MGYVASCINILFLPSCLPQIFIRPETLSAQFLRRNCVILQIWFVFYSFLYSNDDERKDFVVQYAITSDYPKGDYGEIHLWIKPRKTFNYFTIRNYYQSKDYIYLKANKGEEIYHYAYNKKDGTVRRAVRQGKLVERKLPWFSQPYIGFMNGIPDAFSNDICGGYFQMDYRSAGCWVEVINPEPEAIAERIKNIETSEALNATQKEEYLKVLREMNEDSNQTLVIANLK